MQNAEGRMQKPNRTPFCLLLAVLLPSAFCLLHSIFSARPTRDDPATPRCSSSPVKRVLALLALLGATSAHAASPLAAAKSPYLRDHATDAVEWRAWGDKAFAKAKSERKLVFLS